jgi:hypothetical protein
MGLDVSHDAFSGAYSAFNRFRQSVARALGGSFPPHDKRELDPTRWYWGDESQPAKHPGLEQFFLHSDCDGTIEPGIAGQIADEMESILDRIEGGGGHLDRVGGCRGAAERFIRGCRLAHSRGEPLEFA